MLEYCDTSILNISDERRHHRLRHQILSKEASNHYFCFRTSEMMEHHCASDPFTFSTTSANISWQGWSSYSTSSTLKVVSRTFLEQNWMAKTMVSSDFTLRFYNSKKTGKFGQTFNNYNGSDRRRNRPGIVFPFHQFGMKSSN